MSLKCRNDGCKYEVFNMMSLLGHNGRCGRSGVQSEHGANRVMRDESGEVSELPLMQATERDHLVEEIHVDLKKLVEETNEQLDDQSIEVVVNDKMQKHLDIVHDLKLLEKKVGTKLVNKQL